VIAADYPFLDLMWSMLIFFVWILWFMLLFRIWGDVFSRDDLSGLGKTAWLIFTIIVPFLGVFIYVVTQNDGMTKRALARSQAQKEQFDDYVRTTAGSGAGAAAEIEKAKQLLDSGAINQAEFDALKQKAMA
jgi:hypothetical protein